jgi:DNA polymerase-3 subunit epsilon
MHGPRHDGIMPTPSTSSPDIPWNHGSQRIIEKRGMSSDQETCLLRRMPSEIPVRPRTGDETVIITTFDTETTGRDPLVDKIIEVGLVQTEVERHTGRIVDVRKQGSWFQDPGIPIPPEITVLTGITNDDVRGASLPMDILVKAIDESTYMHAHNAFFDQNMMAQLTPKVHDKPWVCSNESIPWRMYGCPTSALGSLTKDFGWFFNGHRAVDDCRAAVMVMGQSPDMDAVKPTFFAESFLTVDDPYRILAVPGSRFESKDMLKAKGFQWNGDAKVWFKACKPLDGGKERMDLIAWYYHHERTIGGRLVEGSLPASWRYRNNGSSEALKCAQPLPTI